MNATATQDKMERTVDDTITIRGLSSTFPPRRANGDYEDDYPGHCDFTVEAADKTYHVFFLRGSFEGSSWTRAFYDEHRNPVPRTDVDGGFDDLDAALLNTLHTILELAFGPEVAEATA